MTKFRPFQFFNYFILFFLAIFRHLCETEKTDYLVVLFSGSLL